MVFVFNGWDHNGLIRQNNKGIAALEQTMKYKEGTLPGDLSVIKSKILEIKDKLIRFYHAMYNADTETKVATSELIAIHYR